jgi:hypothetical protein
MPRRIILREGGLESGNSPEGYKFLGLSENGNLGLKNLDEISEITTFNFIKENTKDEIVKISTGGGSFYLSGNKINQEVSDGDLISGLELDPAQDNNGTRLYTEDGSSGDSSSLQLNPGRLILDSSSENSSISISNGYSDLLFRNSSISMNSVSSVNENISSSLFIEPEIRTTLGVYDLDNPDNNVEIELSTAEITIYTVALFLRNIPTYADNAAAVADDYPVDGIYKTSTGELRIVVNTR